MTLEKLLQIIQEGNGQPNPKLFPISARILYERQHTPGNKRDDGAILVGISPDTQKPMYAAPKDAPCRLDFNEAANYARDESLRTGTEYRVPSSAEARMLFEQKDVIGGFKQEGGFFDVWYWTSREYGNDHDSAYKQDFSEDKEQFWIYKCYKISVRLVCN